MATPGSTLIGLPFGATTSLAEPERESVIFDCAARAGFARELA